MTHGVVKRLGTRAILQSIVEEQALRAQDGAVAGPLRLLGPPARIENSQNRDDTRTALRLYRVTRETQDQGAARRRSLYLRTRLARTTPVLAYKTGIGVIAERFASFDFSLRFGVGHPGIDTFKDLALG
jgi:hypothetical protein